MNFVFVIPSQRSQSAPRVSLSASGKLLYAVIVFADDQWCRLYNEAQKWSKRGIKRILRNWFMDVAHKSTAQRLSESLKFRLILFPVPEFGVFDPVFGIFEQGNPIIQNFKMLFLLLDQELEQFLFAFSLSFGQVFAV